MVTIAMAGDNLSFLGSRIRQLLLIGLHWGDVRIPTLLSSFILTIFQNNVCVDILFHSILETDFRALLRVMGHLTFP